MRQRVIRIFEHERIRIARHGEREDNLSRSIPAPLADGIDRLQRRLGIRALDVGRHDIVARQYVGNLCLMGQSIEILPKLGLGGIPHTMQLVSEMLSVARLVPSIEIESADLKGKHPSLIDAYMDLYIRRLEAEWRRGTIRNYRRVEANRTALKGKILFPKHLRRNAFDATRFLTVADSYESNIKLSQILKAAVHVVTRFAFKERLRASARRLLDEFDEVEDRGFTHAELDNVRIDRRDERFRSLVNLAIRFLKGLASDSHGGSQQFALVFDMNVVFERYIGELVRRYVCPGIGLRGTCQLTGQRLLMLGGRGVFSLRPDIGLHRGQMCAGLIDTKWKKLDFAQSNHGVGQADIYQAYAYGREFDSKWVVLLFPSSDGESGILSDYRHNPPHPYRLLIGRIDLSQGRAQTIRELTSMIAGLETSCRSAHTSAAL